MSQEKGRPLPKFGEWDVNDPASAESYTVIFNKARDEKKTGGKPESPGKADPHTKPAALDPHKTQSMDLETGNNRMVARKNGFAACKILQLNHSIGCSWCKNLNRGTCTCPVSS